MNTPMRWSTCLWIVTALPVGAQQVDVPLDAAHWQATDSIRFESFQGRPSVWINRGMALVQGVALQNGTFEFDLYTGPTAANDGMAFHVRDNHTAEVIFIRPELSGTMESVQYAPALNGLGAAWQIFHGDGANAAVEIPKEHWVHLAVKIQGDTARFFYDHAQKPTVVVPRLALGPDAGTQIGIWASAFRQPTYFSNVSYTPDDTHYATVNPVLPPGTIVDWDLSPALPAETQHPGVLPALSSIPWQPVHAESPGLVLVSRYRAAPGVGAPTAHPDSILGGRVVGSKVVYARTTITAATAGLRRLQIGFSDGMVIYCNGVPLYFGIHPSGWHNLGYMEITGDAVYLPLKAGKNEIVVAVTEFFGGWAFSARLDP
jgi:hypothetical protein